MTIRTRLTLWYAAIFIVSLLLIGLSTFWEISEQVRKGQHKHSQTRHALDEASEMVFRVGLPAVALAMLGGWWLTRRALSPVKALADAIQKTHEHNLREPLPRTHNGDELDQLAKVFNDTLLRLDDSFNRIREFTLHASHELKTPLTVLRGEIETALRDETISDAARERAISQLEELFRLTRIVDGLTLLAKADAGQIALQLETVRLDELIRDNFADTQILAAPQNIEVKLESCTEIFVRGDRHRLRQLLLNLSDNAVKYNQPQGRINLDLRRVGGMAEFTIVNTGAGIPAEFLSRVFERFFRVDAAHGTAGEGCGLGLSIAQWIVSAHGGTIEIISEPENSTVVTVRLPGEKTEVKAV